MQQKGNKKMAVCSFVGHREVYDTDLSSKIQTEVDRLIKEHESVEFLVYTAGTFSDICLLAVLRAKTRYPHKITITLVSYCGSVSEMDNQELEYSYVSDKVTALNMGETKKEDPTIGHKRMVKWIIQNSTHLISYFYDTIYDPNNQLRNPPETLEIIRLTTRETEAAILEAARFMTEKEQRVFHKLREGRTLKEAGEALGVGRERARQLISHGSRIIRSELNRRYIRARAAEKPSAPCTCGLFALGPASYESLTRFKYIMELLSLAYNACDIYVEQSYVFSGFLFILTDSTCLPHSECQKIHITALIGSDALPENDHASDAVKKTLCPPCHAIDYMSRADSCDCGADFDMIAGMIERMDFCLCNLSAAPYAERIQEYAAQVKRAVLIDISP